ncbi:MAG: dipeptidase [SAR86 cluster bacterium]|uniref:Dipeptidase n=1 Tax=SAR86 cluster bacterium TaxID=2030880 RepID=A0A2A5AKC8_9GAMM|nr:MAG: dipeptidase [SAR86 cluster bacterium]
MSVFASLKTSKPNWIISLALLGLVSCSESTTDSENEEAVSNAATVETAASIHATTLVLDAHADIVIPSTSLSYVSDDGTSKVSPDKMQAGGVDAVVMSIAVGPGPRTAQADAAARAEADEKLAAVLALVEESQGSVVIATTVAEIESAHERNQSALILGFQNARSLEGNVSAINEFYQAGVRIFGLNHLGHNDFSDSSRPEFNGETGEYQVAEEHKGLSALGIAAIARINALGAVVDISQLSKAAALQVMRLSTSPVIASHSNAKTISDVTRNLSDEEIDLIGETGGVIHVAAFKGYLLNISEPEFIVELKRLRREAGISEEYNYPYDLYWEIEDPADAAAYIAAASDLMGPATVEHMLDHVDYIVGRIGIDHVGIGNDFNHGSGIEGYDDASEAENITIGLLNRGYSKSEIAKIWSGNFLRVLDAAASSI